MTAQVHEKLIIDGKKLSLACEPTIPEEHPRIKKVWVDGSDLFLQGESWHIKISLLFIYLISLIERFTLLFKADTEKTSTSQSWDFKTSCWRNYIGSWEIKDNKLYLTGIKGMYKLIGDEPLFADWFSGELRVPTGPVIEYVHIDYGSTYETELYIDVENGVVVQQREVRPQVVDED